MTVIGVDVGGTNIDVGLVSRGKILKEYAIPSEAHKGRHIFLENLLEAIKNLKTKDTVAVGLGFPGALDIKKGICITSPNLPIKNFQIRDFIENKLLLPVFMNNDANCFALGEAVYGAGKDYRNVVGITFGTGIGSGIILDKKLYEGRSNAGEFGHMTIDYNGWPCKCGSLGCFEEYCGSRGVMRLAKRISVISPKEVYIQAKKGNADAKKVWEDYGFYLGIGLANVAEALDPDAIILGGKISNAYTFFKDTMKETAEKFSFVGVPPIVKNKLGTKAAILGAAELCRV